MNPGRVLTLFGKELREFRANPSALYPVVLLIVVCLALPFLVIVAVPALSGQSIANDKEFLRVVALAAEKMPVLVALPPEAAVQAFLFQQFLMLFLLAPIIGAVSLAAYSVVGEKQSRTLEPLLTTPLTTAELLVAKVTAAIAPALVLEFVGLASYAAFVGAVAEPGVLATLLTTRTLVLVGLFGPLTALCALQMTIAVSSRATDPRSAQQISILVVLPIVGILVGQIVGAFVVPTWVLLVGCAVLASFWTLLILLSVALFDREKILTEWK